MVLLDAFVERSAMSGNSRATEANANKPVRILGYQFRQFLVFELDHFLGHIPIDPVPVGVNAQRLDVGPHSSMRAKRSRSNIGSDHRSVVRLCLPAANMAVASGMITCA
jgi:hypothetical protein